MLLGLAGKSMSGKDTVADFLISERGWDCKISFAENLKKACASIFDLSESQVFTQSGKREELPSQLIVAEEHLHKIIEWMRRTHNVALDNKPYGDLIGAVLRKPRDILQFVGTEVMRYYVPTYHEDILFEKLSCAKKVIVTDVRYPNEASLIIDNGGILVKISRPYACDIGFSGCTENMRHKSEISLDKWDRWSYILHNNKHGLNFLYTSIDLMLKDLEIP